jgi:hypothetical protein
MVAYMWATAPDKEYHRRKKMTSHSELDGAPPWADGADHEPGFNPTKKRRKRQPFDKEGLLLKIMELAYKKQASFTMAALLNAAGANDTRHSRAYVQSIVKRGLLHKARVLFHDGHYRAIFYGVLTRELPFTYILNELKPVERQVQEGKK